MGRQTAVAMTYKDEEKFLAFLRTTGEIQLLEDFAPTTKKIWVEDFARSTRGHWSYYIWNRRFEWKIKFGRVREDVTKARNPGWFYIENTQSAPVLEYMRHNFSDQSGLSQGRIYWSKFFAASPGEINYDVELFSDWYDQIVRWIRKNGKKKEKGAGKPYFYRTPFL